MSSRAERNRLRTDPASDGRLARRCTGSWDELRARVQEQLDRASPTHFQEMSPGLFRGELGKRRVDIALEPGGPDETLVRLTVALPKPPWLLVLSFVLGMLGLIGAQGFGAERLAVKFFAASLMIAVPGVVGMRKVLDPRVRDKTVADVWRVISEASGSSPPPALRLSEADEDEVHLKGERRERHAER
jgi:hypothetical protein